MARYNVANPPEPPDEFDRPKPPPIPKRPGPGKAGSVVLFFLACGIVYGLYFWFIRRVVVANDEVLVLIKKDGSRSLPGDQIIIPAAPEEPKGEAGKAAFDKAYAEWKKEYDAWEKQYGDCNGILEEVKGAGVYFGFSPFDYEREIQKRVQVKDREVGIVIRKFGDPLPEGQILADLKKKQRGPLADVLQPASYIEYSNPYAYEVKSVRPVEINPGSKGVVTIMAGPEAKKANEYLVEAGEQGVQKILEDEGYRYINPYQKRVMPISIQSQKYEMKGDEDITFPSSDSFPIHMEAYVEWHVDQKKLPLMYVQYSEGAQLIRHLDDKVILPYSRSLCRTIGSEYPARDFVSGNEAKLKFQQEFETKLKALCAAQGIEILHATIQKIIPPEEIKNPINDREVARLQIETIQQQIKRAESDGELAKQTELGTQNTRTGETRKEVITITKKAEQEKSVAMTKARQELAVATLKLEAAKKESAAMVSKGTAEANVLLLQKKAEAEPLRQQVAAFGDGEAFAQYFFYQKIAPSIKSILSNTDGPFADVFKQFNSDKSDKSDKNDKSDRRATTRPAGDKITGGQQ